MVKLYSINVLYKASGSVTPLSTAHDLQSFGFFQRTSAKEFMEFTSKIIVERTPVASRSSVREKEYMCHVFVRSDNLAGVIVADHEYPHRVAHTLITKVLEDFSEKVPSTEWPVATEGSIMFPILEAYLVKYQNPREADAMTKIQADLDETKIILHNTIEAVLQRGEKLDDLVSKSEQLSTHSKAFYTTARKTNRSCCVIS